MFSTPRAMNAVLLARADVQCELGIDDQQSHEVHEWLCAVRDHALDHFPQPLEAERIAEATGRTQFDIAADFINAEIDHSDTALAEVLNAVQLERLYQLRLQRDGVHVFDRPEIIDGLRLTEAQLRKIERLSPFAMAPYASIEVSDACRMELNQILTPMQREVWQATIGEVFRFDDAAPSLLEYEMIVALTGMGPLHCQHP